MNFYDGKEEETIKEYKKHNNGYYEITYLNGESDYYYNDDPNHEEEIKEKMISQIIKRDLKFYNKCKIDYIGSTIVFLASLPLSLESLKKDLTIVFIIATIIGAKSLMELCENRKKLKELKKYRMYLEIAEELEKEENKNILDVIEFDKMYQVPLNLNTLDGYKNWEIKTLRKEINRRKQENN